MLINHGLIVFFLFCMIKRINISIETLEVFSPLAQRLGMKEWQDELEDLSFQSINRQNKGI